MEKVWYLRLSGAVLNPRKDIAKKLDSCRILFQSVKEANLTFNPLFAIVSILLQLAGFHKNCQTYKLCMSNNAVGI